MTLLEPPPSLRFASDDGPGIRRQGRTRFRYVHAETGRPVSADDAARIASLAIPPAWTDVWISPDPSSHLQATGRDAKGRKQYRYHKDFTAHRSAAKFDDLVPFGQGLGALRRQVAKDLVRGAGLRHDHVVAVLVRLLDLTYLRVGNEQYAKQNRSYGLTTLRNQHVAVQGSRIRLRFRGKSAHRFDITLESRELARLIRRCQDLPGQHLFQYQDADGEIRPVGSGDVNDYVRRHGSPTATAKTFRTWGGTVLAGELLAAAAERDEPATARTVKSVIDDVASRLGNTPTVCRTSYVHPAVVEQFLEGSFLEQWSPPPPRAPMGLSPDERRMLRFLAHRT